MPTQYTCVRPYCCSSVATEDRRVSHRMFVVNS